MAEPLDYSKYFGEGNVIDKDGKTVKFEPNDYDVIGLYFSAHWCPPCRGFTPQLAEYYENVKKNNRKLQIIFISSDRDEASFKGYLADMPWLALDFSKRELKGELANKYSVSGIPKLVFLRKDGTVVTQDGRGQVGKDLGTYSMSWLD